MRATFAPKPWARLEAEVEQSDPAVAHQQIARCGSP
jgi:hypothetical protein